MKSKLTKEQYEKIYKMLDKVSPIDTDCGLLCGAACCTIGKTAGAEEMGIYLLPGEEKLHDRKDDWLSWSVEKAEDYEFPDSWKGALYFVRCVDPPHCPREKRPIQCRSFPLLPHLDENDVLSMVYNDYDIPYRCPLIDDEIPLNDDFVETTLKAWAMLIEDPLIYDLVKMDSEARDKAAQEMREKFFG